MKKTILFLLALVTMGEAAKAQTITVADVEALPGETVAFSVDLTGGKDTKYTAFQFDVQFPATGFSTTGAYTVSPSWTGASCVVGSVDETGLATVPFASANEIQGTDVEGLVTVSFTVDGSVALGEYDVTLKNIFLAYNTSDKDYPADVTFKVKVVSAHSVLLDETSTEAPIAANGVNVRVKRTIKANEWSTICLPFAMTAAQTKAAFGDDVLLGDFNGYETTEDDGGDITGITVKFNSATAIEANHPYIIKVSAAVTEFTVDGVDVDPDDAEINKGTNRKPKAFIGNYVAGTAVENGCLFLNNNKFWYSVGTTTIKGYRAYFNFFDLLTDFEDNYAEAPVFISFGNETTGINDLQQANDDGRYYNLNGQHVTNVTKGLYIKNGKKVVVK